MLAKISLTYNIKMVLERQFVKMNVSLLSHQHSIKMQTVILLNLRALTIHNNGNPLLKQLFLYDWEFALYEYATSSSSSSSSLFSSLLSSSSPLSSSSSSLPLLSSSSLSSSSYHHIIIIVPLYSFKIHLLSCLLCLYKNDASTLLWFWYITSIMTLNIDEGLLFATSQLF